MFDAAVAAASANVRIPPYLPAPPKGRTIVVGAGKASAAMAKAVENAWSAPLSGLVVTRYGHAVPCERIEVVEAAHPVPDESGYRAAKRMLEMVSGLGGDDLVLALISGGGSALLSLPAPGLSFADKQSVNAALLRSGAAIGEINTVRKHLSAIKGGRLANTSVVLVATPQLSLEAAAEVARKAGVRPVILGDAIEGEAREVGKVMAAIAREVVLHGQPAPPPAVLLSGGETTVTVRGKGRGGRNVEFLLSLALTLDGLPGIFALAGDTDGVDGAEEIAGAIVAPDTLVRAAQRGINIKECLADNDAHSFFEALGDQVITGPTLTNVNDFRAILVLER